MSSTILYRLSGISLFGGGVLIALGYIFHPSDDPAYLATSLMILVHLMIFFGIFFLLLGLIGMYARQSSRAGMWGLIGMLLLFFGLLMLEMPHAVAFFALGPGLVATKIAPQQAESLVNNIFASPALSVMQLLSIPMAVLGVITTAIVTLRARMLSRGIPIALFSILGLEVLTFIPVISDVMTTLKFPAEIYLCFAAVGVLILLDKGAETQPESTEARRKLEVPTSSARG
jgi:hypothetical protein